MMTGHSFAPLLLLLSIAIVTTSSAQWVPTSGPSEIRYDIPAVHALTAQGAYLFAGTNRGVFRSTDFGDHWEIASVGISPPVRYLAYTSGHLFAGTDSGMYVSGDNGARWSRGFAARVLCVAVDADTLFAGTDSGVYRSRDGGSSWKAVNDGSADLPIDALTATGGNLFAHAWGTLYGSTSGGDSLRALDTAWIFAANGHTIIVASMGEPSEVTGTFGSASRSSDDGASWVAAGELPRQVFSGYSHRQPSEFYRQSRYSFQALTASDGDFIVALTYGANPSVSGIYVSTDSGASWRQKIGDLEYPYRVTDLIVRGGAAIALAGPKLLLSTNDGADWRSSALVPGPSIKYAAMIDGKLFAATDSGLYRSADTGRSWTDVSIVRPYAFKFDVGNLVSNDIGNLFAGTSGGGVFRSSDGGGSWSPVNYELPPHSTITAMTAAGTRLLVAIDSAYQVDAVYRSTNNGTEWSLMRDGWSGVVSALGFDGKYLFAATIVSYVSDTIYRSSDFGTSWKVARSGIQGYSSIETFKAIGIALYAGWGFGVLRSTNSGGSWVMVDNGLPFFVNGYCLAHAAAFAAIGTSVFAGINGSGDSDPGGGVYRSTNAGGRWTAVNDGLPEVPYVTGLAADGTNLFAIVNDSVYRTQDGGMSWTAASEGLPARPAVRNLAVNGGALFAGTTAGVWSRPLSDFPAGVDKGHEFSEEITLSRNIPDPFGASTTLSYFLPSRGPIVLSVFDARGEEIAVLARGVEEPGEHVVSIRGDDLSSGVYWCRLRAGALSRTEKLIVIH